MSEAIRADLVVIGGGLTGLALAVAVASAGARVLLVERQRLERMALPDFDGRVTAVAQGSRRLLEAIGVWPGLAAGAEPILDIEVGEAGAAAGVHYDHRAVGSEPLGHIVANGLLREALLARAQAIATLEIAAPATVARLERGPVVAELELADGRIVRTGLVAAAEGKHSATRAAAGIGCRSWSYRQTGLVTSFAHALPHHGIASERFFPDGPLAMLPMAGQRSSLVWALDQSLAEAVSALDDASFAAEVEARLGPRLGRLTLEGPRWRYPLELSWADAYAARRLVLVGDTARGIHPIAGQGWNLALRDVAAIAELVVDRLRLGLDPGDDATLERYAAWRRFDGLALVAVTDGINRLFANDLQPLRLARNLGLALVEQLPPVKRLLMRHAMGLTGDLPRTMRGLPL